MKELFKKNRSVVSFFLGLIFFTLAIRMTPKNLSTIASAAPPSDEGKSFLIFFIIGLIAGFLALLAMKGNFFKKNISKAEEQKIISNTLPGTYQHLIDETEAYKAELKKCRKIVIAYVATLWTVTWLGRFSGHPLYSSPILSSFLFITAFIVVGIVIVQKESRLDARIADCVLRGIELEKNHLNLRSNYFQDSTSRYQGWGMMAFLFMRISPLLWLLFSGIQVGGLEAITDLFPIVLSWNINNIAWLLFAALTLFLGMMVYRPYERLTRKMKAEVA